MYPRRWTWRWRRNPVRRRCDLAEAWVRVLAIATVVLGTPVAGAAGAQIAYDHLAHIARQQRQDRSVTAAVLLHDAPRTSSADDSLVMGDNGAHPWVKVRWKAPDGTSHTGPAQVRPGDRAGTTTPVWVNRHGHLTSPPPDRAQTRGQSVSVGVIAGAGTSAGLIATGRHALHQLERTRLEAWEDAWVKVEPQWRSDCQ